MPNEISRSDVQELSGAEKQNYQDIKPESGMSVSEANHYWDDMLKNDVSEKIDNQEQDSEKHLISNKQEGLRREGDVEQELRDQYPEKSGNTVVSEAYLRNQKGNIVKDRETGEARRIDFVVIKDGEVIDSIEVTSLTADKTEQTAKENRIREDGGNFIKDFNGNLVEIPEAVHTRIERRE